MSQWPPSTPGTFGQDSGGSPDALMRVLQFLHDHLIQPPTPSGDVSDPAALARERVRVIADYGRQGASPNQLSASPMTPDVLARAASAPPAQYQQGNPASTDALIAELVDQTHRAAANPQDSASRQQIGSILETLNTQGITPDQALALAQQDPSPTPIPPEAPIVPELPGQFTPSPAPGPAPPVPSPEPAPPAPGMPGIDPAVLQQERNQVQADYASPPPSAPMLPSGPTPPGQLSALDLGVNGGPPPRPTMPTPPGLASRDPKQDLMRIITLGLMLGAGPRSGIGSGAGQGFLHAQAAQQAEQDRQFALKERDAEKQRALGDQKDKQLQAQLMTVSKRVEQIKTKAQYDQEITGYANLLRQAHPWMTANWLRQAVPFVAPDAAKFAKTAVEGFLKNPANQTLISQHPDQLSQVMLMIDRDGDGHLEQVPLLKAAQIAGIPFGVDANGTLITYPKGTTADSKASADGIFEDLLAQAKAEGKDPNSPRLRMSLREQAIKQAKDAGRDPDMQSLAASTAQLRNEMLQMQVGQQPTQDDAAKMATQLLEHKMAPSQLSLLGGFGAAGQAFKRMILIEAQKQDPTFNLEEAESTYQLAKSPGFQQQIRYMSSVQESMPRLLQNAQTLANGNVRAVTGLINAGKNQFNNVDLKKFQTDVTLVADEVAKILQGGGTGSGTSDAKLKQASALLSTTDSPAAIASALEEINALIGFRQKALTRGTYLDQAPKGTTESAPDLIYDPTTKTFTRPRGR